MRENASTSAHETASSGRLPWTTPAVKDLPRLSELTLQTGGAIDGGIGTGGGGSTVF
jgi:hypothetical protein